MGLRCSGFSLTEVMVSVFVLAVGIIGTAGMQATALRSARQASHQSAASEFAEEMTEAIHAASARLAREGGANPFVGVDYRTASGEPTSPGVDCMRADADCSPQSLAAFDVYVWEKRMHDALPSSRLVICRDERPWNETARDFEWSCSGSPGAPLVVKIGWQERDADGHPTRNGAGEFSPATVLAVPDSAA